MCRNWFAGIMFAKNTKLFIYLHQKMNACINSVHSYNFETRGQWIKFVLAAAAWLLLLATAGGLFAQAPAITVKALDPNPAATSLYSFTFNLSDSLPPQGAISILFAEGFDLSNVSIAASSVIKGGLTPYVKGREVIVVRRGEGGALKSGERVDILLSAIKNPAGPGPFTLKVFLHRDGARLVKERNAGTAPLLPDAKGMEGQFTLGANQ